MTSIAALLHRSPSAPRRTLDAVWTPDGTHFVFGRAVTAPAYPGECVPTALEVRRPSRLGNILDLSPIMLSPQGDRPILRAGEFGHDSISG